MDRASISYSLGSSLLFQCISGTDNNSEKQISLEMCEEEEMHVGAQT